MTRGSSGKIDVTIRQLRDPAGLQRTLRADGVPASVTFLRHPDPACRTYVHNGTSSGEGFGSRPASPQSRQTVFVIDPASLPPGAGVEIGAGTSVLRGPGGPGVTGMLGYVYATPACTG